MKKTLSILLCVTFVLTLCACVDHSPPPGRDNTTSATVTGESSAADDPSQNADTSGDLSGDAAQSHPGPQSPNGNTSANGTQSPNGDTSQPGTQSPNGNTSGENEPSGTGTQSQNGDTSGTGTQSQNGNASGNGEAVTAHNIDICLSGEPDTLDPARVSTLDTLTMTAHLFTGLARWDRMDDGAVRTVPDAAVSLPDGMENEDGSVTYTYTLRDGLTWSDGQPLRARDFVFAWNRAASVDTSGYYAYLLEPIRGYADVRRLTSDGSRAYPDARLAVEAPDDKTLQVTLSEPLFGWNQLLAFPTFFPVREDIVSENENWASNAASYVCDGPYTLTAWEHDSLITLTKNSAYPDAASVTVETLTFHLSGDDGEMLESFAAGDLSFVDRVPAYAIEILRERYPEQLRTVGQLGTYYVCWNVNAEILPGSSTLTGADAERARAEIRQAISLLIDRNYITDSIAQAGQVPAASLVPMGMTNADGSQFCLTAGHRSDYSGYYDVSPDAVWNNYDAALNILNRYYTFDEMEQGFTDFPVMTYLYNANEGHKAIAEYLQSALAGVEILMRTENPELNVFRTARKNGDFTLARNAYLADYDDPLLFLEMWTSDSDRNDAQLGRGAHTAIYAYSLDLTPYGYENRVENGSWADTYDVLIRLIRSCTDAEIRSSLLHEAEDLLMSTGCVMPLYFYTDLYLVRDNVKDVYVNPLGMKYFTRCTVS